MSSIVEWRKYPFIRIFIPFLLGIILGAFLASDARLAWLLPVAQVADAYAALQTMLFVALGASACMLILSYGVAGRRRIGGRAFRLSTHVLFLSLGMLLSVRSHRMAIDEHGEQYIRRIYYTNNLQSEKALQVREKLHAMFPAADSVHAEAAALAEAMTIGMRQELSHETRWQFSAAGISHLLSLSGFHLSIIYLFFSTLFVWARGSIASHYLSRLLLLALLWCYAFVTGMSPSIVRAVIFCTIVELSMMLQRDVRLINSCAIAAAIILAIDPLLICHVGFQLSFCSLAGIALLQRRIPSNRVLATIAVTLICTLFTFPLVGYHFYYIPVYGLLSNLIATVPAFLVVVLSVFWWLLSALGIPCLWLLHAILGMSSILIQIARTVSSLPYARISYPPDIAEVIVWYIIILSLTALLHKFTARRLIFLLACIECLLLYLVFQAHFLL